METSFVQQKHDMADDVSLLHNQNGSPSDEIASEASAGQQPNKSRTSDSTNYKFVLLSAALVACLSFVALKSQIYHPSLEWPNRNEPAFVRGNITLRTLQFDTLSFSTDDLCHLVLQMFMELELPKIGRFEEEKMKTLILEVRGTMQDNPYHNWFHVVDVTQVVFSLVLKAGMLNRLSSIQLFALLVSALCHDLDHPGLNNPFLVSSSADLAILYNDRSPLENHHSSFAFRLMHRSKILEKLEAEEYVAFRQAVISNILATDMGRHRDYVVDLKRLTESQALPAAGTSENVQLETELLLKYADISSVWRPFDVARKWAIRVTNEFFAQGDEERSRGMPISAGMDRASASRVAVQKGFIDFVVLPYSRSMALLFRPLEETLSALLDNRRAWDALADADLVPQGQG
jgi:hypothetical protein